MDLNDLFTGAMTPDECWQLILHLPRTSALMAALATDPAYSGDGKPGPPPWTEFGPVEQALAGIYDLQAALLSTVASLGGGKPPKIPPYPRPADPAAAAREAEKRQQHKALLKRIGIGGE